MTDIILTTLICAGLSYILLIRPSCCSTSQDTARPTSESHPPLRLIRLKLREPSNARGICQGQLDIPLNDEGKEEAKDLARLCRDLPLTSIYSSDLSRAHEVSLKTQRQGGQSQADDLAKTAQVIASEHPGVSVSIDAALKEQHWGSIQGHPHDSVDRATAGMEPQSEYVPLTPRSEGA